MIIKQELENISFYEKLAFYALAIGEFAILLLYRLLCLVYYCIFRLFLPLRDVIRKPSPSSPFQKLKSQRRSKKILLLDLDGTLIYTSPRPMDKAAKISVNGKTIFVNKRPNLEKFIEEAHKMYTLGVYTSSIEDYADKIVKIIELEKVIPKKMRFYRNNCENVRGDYRKRVSKIEADLRNVLLLDNRPEMVADRKNTLGIRSWNGEEGDEELLRSLEKLRKMYLCDDVRMHL
ncbi:hypothetical protein SteCoe_28168 [Stentor coeruleus]|uniref:Mitochondrial import inner membrane translocase subunit TIM50 n=1 Tax=Stentor coeruleus TaxID=5963 RepID=A0A1R2B8S5_9CILI|nr:hypothetical protein SteCoe_28168 [Stentor coeruleus]